MSTPLTVQEILQILRKDGELWYFYLSGGVAVHGNKCESSSGKYEPIRGKFCSIEVFLSLRSDGFD